MHIWMHTCEHTVCCLSEPWRQVPCSPWGQKTRLISGNVWIFDSKSLSPFVGMTRGRQNAETLLQAISFEGEENRRGERE